jgi:hypothetical protein
MTSKTRLVTTTAAWSAGVAVLFALTAAADVQPRTAAVNLYRTPGWYAAPMAAAFFPAETVRLTNCTAYADADGATTQDLTAVAITIRAGNYRDGWQGPYTGRVNNATAGTWSASFTAPTNRPAYLRITLTHTNGNAYTYPLQPLSLIE